MARIFDQRAVIDTPSKNVFKLSYRSRLSAVMGQLIPVMHKEVIPGDRFRVGFDTLIRLAPLKAPIFDGVKADFHAFFVPNRILDPKWKEFISDGNSLNVGQISYDDDTRPSPLSFSSLEYTSWGSPQGENRGFHLSGLFDYLNLHVAKYNTDGTPYIGTGSGNADEKLNALPILGYHKIWSDWYRNERVESGIALGGDGFTGLCLSSSDDRLVDGLIQDGVVWSSVGAETNLFDQLHWRNYKKDRYTTALPEPVIGGPVVIPGSGGTSGSGQLNVTKADALYDVDNLNSTVRGSVVAGSGDEFVSVGAQSSAGTNDYYMNIGNNPTGTLSSVISNRNLISAFSSKKFVTDVSLVSQLSNAAQATIQELKTAFKMYSFFMKDTYNGNRYVEFMESHYNVRVPDATVDRAIFLGKATVPIRFGEVFQTSGQTETGSNSLGDYAGRGVGAGSAALFDDTFYEHGQLYVIMSIVPTNTYFQGIDPKFIKSDRFDYFFPEFQNIGDVAIKSKELFFDPSVLDASDDVFGYQSRWYEYKQFNDELHGDFIPNTEGEGSNMSFWNFARQFADAPVLSPEFSQVKPQNAPFVQLDEWSDNYLIYIQWNIKALRPIMYYESF